MSAGRILGITLAVAVMGTWSSGCTDAPKAGPVVKADSHEGHDHGHEHVHSGPHNGKIMVIGEEEYHAEWTHDESGKVTFYILDAAGKKEVPIDGELLTIEVKVGDNPVKKYELLAVNAKDGKASAFEIVDKEFASLFGQLKSSGLALTLAVTIHGKQFTQPVKEHEHH